MLRDVAVTRDLFPVGRPVTVEAIIDGACGWEFDAPMHIMRPFHRCCIISSIWPGVLEDRIEDLLISLDIGQTIEPDTDCWPYDERYLCGLFRRARAGRARSGVWFLRSVVTVNSWGDTNSVECVDYTCETKLFHRGQLEPAN